jgi:hypothetical protein
MLTQVSAQDLFQAAYDNRYTWGHPFPGYEADILWKDHEHTVTGRIRINPDLKGEVLSISDEAASKEIQNQLWEIGIHRIRKPFAEVHGQNEFSYGNTQESGAVEIHVTGKAMGDRYEVHQNRVTLVHRHMGSKIVTIRTFSTLDTGSGYLPLEYDSVYQDAASGEIQGVTRFTDDYIEVSGYFILKTRRMVSQKAGTEMIQELTFSGIQLLP